MNIAVFFLSRLTRMQIAEEEKREISFARIDLLFEHIRVSAQFENLPNRSIQISRDDNDLDRPCSRGHSLNFSARDDVWNDAASGTHFHFETKLSNSFAKSINPTKYKVLKINKIKN